MTLSFDLLAVSELAITRLVMDSVTGLVSKSTATVMAQCLPLTPLESELREQFDLGPHTDTLRTYVMTQEEIRAGDTLAIDGAEYQIRACEKWDSPFYDDHIYLLIVDRVKK